MSDCDEVKFYGPQATRADGTKQGACGIPVPLNPAEELLRKPDPTQADADEPSLGDILLYNKTVTASCPEDAVPRDVTVSSGTFSYNFKTEVESTLSEDMVAFIISAGLEEGLSSVLNSDEDEAVVLNKLCKLLKTPVSGDVARMYELSQAHIVTLTASATTQAEALLSCSWLNDLYVAECPDKDVAASGDLEGAVDKVVIAADTVSSSLSKDDANQKAQAMGDSMLNCVWVNDLITVTCQDLPGFVGQGIVPNDTEPVLPELPKRVGEVVVPPAAFTSTISKDDANQKASSWAQSQLSCFYVSDPVHIECDDPTARPSDDVTAEEIRVADIYAGIKGQSVTAPAGFYTSQVSTQDATELATIAVQALLECCFGNDEIYRECPAVKATDVSGDEITDVNGNPVLIYASQVASPLFSVSVAPNTIISCTSKEEANELAEMSVMASLECYYCNTIVLPTCVPQWVSDAALYGITVTREDGSTFLYKLPLPLDLTAPLINPLTQEEEDVSSWSVDATVGISEDVICTPDYTQSQSIATNVAVAPVTDALDERSHCAFSNDLVLAACAARNPYDPSSLLKYQTGKTPEGKNYIFYSKHGVTSSVTNEISSPITGEYVTVAAGTITVTALDAPGTLPTTDPNYNKDVNDYITKQYANTLALKEANNMLSCNFGNPITYLACEYSRSVGLNSNVWQLGLEKDEIEFLSPSSITEANSNILEVAKNTYTSSYSMADVYDKVIKFMEAVLLCRYCSAYVNYQCGPEYATSDGVQLEDCMFEGATREEATEMASKMAEGVANCVEDGGGGGEPGPPGAPCEGNCYGVYS